MQEEIYRSCASIAVFRPSSVCSPDGCGLLHEILLVHKPRKKDAWQLPQGGVEEGETIVQAATRELQEEAGIEASVLGVSTTVYQYNFPASYRRFRPDHVKGQHISFVLAVADVSVQVQVDQEEIDSYSWVLPEQIPQYIKRKAYLKIVQQVYKEGVEHLTA